jgi:hypothetical protein
MGATAAIAIAAAVPIRGVTDARAEMARGVAVEDRTYETVPSECVTLDFSRVLWAADDAEAVFNESAIS